MKNIDLLLLHAPSVYDFRKLPILFGPISDIIPSTAIFEMYPVGMTRIAAYLDKHGYKCRIINFALKMLLNPHYDPELIIKSIKPKLLYGIDLHWLPHSHGSLEIAKLIKKHHPEIPIVFGGLSSTYFHETLIKYPYVDFVMRGDSTEEPMLALMHALKTNKDFASVPNLTWKKDGKIIVNDLSYVPDKLHDVSVDYKYVIKSVLKYRDLSSYLPFRYWVSYPIIAIMTVHGCVYNCQTCGGSAAAFKFVCKRDKPVFFSPESIIRTIKNADRFIRGPLFIIGDPLQPGKEYGKKLVSLLKEAKIKNQLAMEFFTPPPRDFLKAAKDAVPNISLEISPDSHDEKIRFAYGRPYLTSDLERMIDDCIEFDYYKIDLFFTIGLPLQTTKSVEETMDYCEYLMEKYKKHSNKLFLYISPLVPFIDPGSPAYENPEKYGYRVLCNTLEEHRTALTGPTWKYMYNYETIWMTRDEMVKATYDAAERLNKIKLKYGQLSAKKARDIENSIQLSVKIIDQIDEILKTKDQQYIQKELYKLKPQMDKLNENILCDKRELDRPLLFKGITIPRPIQDFVTDAHTFLSRAKHLIHVLTFRYK